MLLKRCCNSSGSIFYPHPYIFSNPLIISPGGTGEALSFLGRDAFCVKSPQEVGWAPVGLPSVAYLHLPGSAGLYRIPWTRGAAVAPGFPQAGGLCARPAHAASSLQAETATQAPNEGSYRSSNYLFSQLTTSLPAPFMAFYCPAGTKNRKWNGNNWNARYDAAIGKLPTHWPEFPIRL